MLKVAAPDAARSAARRRGATGPDDAAAEDAFALALGAATTAVPTGPPGGGPVVAAPAPTAAPIAAPTLDPAALAVARLGAEPLETSVPLPLEELPGLFLPDEPVLVADPDDTGPGAPAVDPSERAESAGPTGASGPTGTSVPAGADAPMRPPAAYAVPPAVQGPGGASPTPGPAPSRTTPARGADTTGAVPVPERRSDLTAELTADLMAELTGELAGELTGPQTPDTPRGGAPIASSELPEQRVDAETDLRTAGVDVAGLPATGPSPDLPAAPAATPPARVPTGAVAELSAALRRDGEGNASIVVRLDPPELGTVVLSLSARGGEVRMVVAPEDPTAVGALELQHGDIAAALRAEGLDLDDYVVRSGAESTATGDRREDAAGGASGGPSDRRPDDAPTGRSSSGRAGTGRDSGADDGDTQAGPRDRGTWL